jgi:hypothetical protein
MAWSYARCAGCTSAAASAWVCQRSLRLEAAWPNAARVAAARGRACTAWALACTAVAAQLLLGLLRLLSSVAGWTFAAIALMLLQLLAQQITKIGLQGMVVQGQGQIRDHTRLTARSSTVRLYSMIILAGLPTAIWQDAFQ